MTGIEIQNFTETELFADSTFDALYAIEKPHTRARKKELLRIRAKELGVIKEFDSCLKAYDIEDFNEKHNDLGLELTGSGKFKSTIDNHLKIIENDTDFAGRIMYNEFKNVMELKLPTGDIRQWTDADDSNFRSEIELKYQISSRDKYEDAMRIYAQKHSYHPLRDYVDSLTWDGVSRIENFLSEWTKCGNSPYHKEASRLLFAGGIARLYTPGCKQEDIIVLIGPQGCGKTTLVHWLALDDKYYDDISEFKEEVTAQKLQGIWLCELAELSALKKSKDVETVKSFTSRQNDRYRAPYARHVTDHPRQTFFVGTSNERFFISDLSGGRRFYPVICHCSAQYIYEHEETIKDYIRQCWAEARIKYLTGELKVYPNPQLLPAIRAAQDGSVEEDWMKSAVLSYIETKAKTCVLEIWHEGLKKLSYEKPTKHESRNINLILQNSGEWEPTGNVNVYKNYGRVRTWQRTAWDKDDKVIDDLFSNLEV